ncbi:MAG: WhiB family transcriptional regulator [Microthrixaceae bacterium]|nr:WhiB family transcriptional regulator [Microthrixaceae bacterium]MCO5312117.1 WhiB family transcriptional regulator [Microthrixaceae bacterium]HPB44946.1 WhiB family transcriptional regulator [Microthrixaceae bacterium]
MSALPLTLEPDTSWHLDAACAAATPGTARLFFSDDLSDIIAAKTICSTCPVISECLDTALARQEQWGVWGGQLIVAGKVVMTKRRRGRPPKTPRPEDQMPQIPFPEHLRHLQPA